MKGFEKRKWDAVIGRQYSKLWWTLARLRVIDTYTLSTVDNDYYEWWRANSYERYKKIYNMQILEQNMRGWNNKPKNSNKIKPTKARNWK